MAAGASIEILTSAAYATTAVFAVQCPIFFLPVRCCSNRLISGFETNANVSMLIRQSCLREHCVGRGPAT